MTIADVIGVPISARLKFSVHLVIIACMKRESNTMGFVVLPAMIPDISAVYDVYFAAFANDRITHALFPNATNEDLTNPDSEFR